MFEELVKTIMRHGIDKLPLVGENQYGEAVIITASLNDDNTIECVEKQTLQDNGWTRINCYWADGTIEELYDR